MQTCIHKETDNQLRGAVATQIDWEPQVLSRDIGVDAHDGVITLTGFVRNSYEKLAAERAAKSVYGVKAIANDIEVKPVGTRTDPEIARDLMRALAGDVAVPEEHLQATVKEGFVTLEGTVEWHFYKASAAACANRIAGVRGVINNLAVKPPAQAIELNRIEGQHRAEDDIAAVPQR